MGIERTDLSAHVDAGQMAARRIQQAFKYGITNDMIYGGLEPGQSAIQGLYADAQVIKNCAYGTRRVRWDGRVFRYAKCGGHNIPSTERGAHALAVLVVNKVTAGNNRAVANIPTHAKWVSEVVLTLTANTIGDSTTILAAARDGVVAKDELKGGYVSFRTGGFPSLMQTRGIVGNTALATGGTSITLTLDEPLNFDLTTGVSTCEILAPPYACVGIVSDMWVSVMGMPNVLAEIGSHLWLQTWGPLRIAPTENLGDTERERQFVFDAQGCVVPAADSFAANIHSYQHAGFLLEKIYGDAGSAAPFIMLQISP